MTEKGEFVSGEVGVLGEENAQRLCSAFSEFAFECLNSLAHLSGKHGGTGPSFLQLYGAGLNCVPQWTHEVLKEEVAGLQAQYPEAELLYQYCYLSLLADLGERGGGEEDLKALLASMPPLSKFYHLFLIRVCTSPDVVRGRFFFDQPHAQRRVVFIEAFRNALHDVVRRQQRQAAATVIAAVQQPSQKEECRRRPATDGDDTKSQGSQKSVFQAAVGEEKRIPRVEEESDADDDKSASGDERTVQVSPSPCFFAADPSAEEEPSSVAW